MTVNTVNVENFSNSSIVIIKDVVDRLKLLFKNMYDSTIVHIQNYNEDNYSKKFTLIVDDLMNNMNDFLIYLQKYDVFYYESFDYMEIMDIFEYVLRRDWNFITIDEINFVKDLFELFDNLIDKKLVMLKNSLKFQNNLEEYQKDYDKSYESFSRKFFKMSEKFFDEFYNESWLDEKILINYCHNICQ